MSLLSKVKENTTTRNGILFSLFSFLNNGISFLLLLVLAKFVPLESYGQLNLFNTLVTFLTIIISLNTVGVISVEFFRSSGRDFRRTLNSVLSITTAVFFFISLFLIFFSDFLETVIGLSVYYLWIALLVCYFQVFSNINLEIYRLEEKPISYGFYSIFIVLLNFSFTLFLIILFHFDWSGRVYAQVGVGLLFFVISIFFMVKRGYLIKLCPTKVSLKNALNFGIPLIPHNTSFWMRQGLDRYIINYSHGASAVGLFSFSFNFANIIQIVGVAFNATNSVFIYKNLAKDDSNMKALLLKQTKTMILFFILLSIIVCFGSGLLIPIVLPKYSESVIYLFPLCMGAMFHCIYLLFVNYLFYYKKTKHLMFITFSISIFHSLLSVILTQYSIMYTAYISFLTNFLIALCVFLYSRKIYKVI